MPALDANLEGALDAHAIVGMNACRRTWIPPLEQSMERRRASACLEAAESLFDDGDDAPELTEVETSLLDGTSPDTSLFESTGTDLSTTNRGSPKKG